MPNNSSAKKESNNLEVLNKVKENLTPQQSTPRESSRQSPRPSPKPSPKGSPTFSRRKAVFEQKKEEGKTAVTKLCCFKEVIFDFIN